MKFIVSTSALLKQLQTISGVISTNTVMPILEDFLFVVKQNELTVTACDLETTMTVSLPIEAKEEGSVCIPAKILIDSLKNLPDQPLTFNIDSNYGIELISDSGKYKVMGEEAHNFPKEPIADDTTSFSMFGSNLVTAINKTLFAVSSDELRPAMTGVFFDILEDRIQFVATDAHRLVKYSVSGVNSPKIDSFIVPRKPLTLLKNALPATDEAINISYNAGHLFVAFKTATLSCRLIDARFPDYKVVIPTNNPYQMVVNRVDFQQGLRRVNIFGNKSTNQVALNITANQLQLQAQDIDFSFEGVERLACTFNGEEEGLNIVFNAKFLIELLSATDTNEVVVELSSGTRAGIIRPSEQTEGEDLMMLAMPLMLTN